MRSAFASGGRVLVHCYVGKSRSAAVVLGYLMARQHLTLAAATALLTRVRPQIQPNRGFYRELQDLDQRLFALQRESEAEQSQQQRGDATPYASVDSKEEEEKLNEEQQ